MRVAKGACHRNFIRFFKSALALQFSGMQSLVRLRTPLCAPEQYRGTLQTRLRFVSSLHVRCLDDDPRALIVNKAGQLRTTNFELRTANYELFYCCNTTWSPSFSPFTTSVCDPFDRPTETATLRIPSFWLLSGTCTNAFFCAS